MNKKLAELTVRKSADYYNKDVTLKDIALELLQKYEESETSLIWEYSGDIDKSEKYLDAEVAKYRELIDKYAEQEPKTGHWILQPSNKEQGERDFIWWKCSECGQVIFSETEKDRREYHAFCGKCGAKMVEQQERR